MEVFVRVIAFMALSFFSLVAQASESALDLDAIKKQTSKAISEASANYQNTNNTKPTGGWDYMPKSNAPYDIGSYLNNKNVQAMNPYMQDGKLKGIIFISFSMPEDSIKRYLYQASKVNNGRTVKLVVIGLDESKSLIKTQRRIAKLMKGHSAEVDIDPGAFERFQIKSVPAFAFYEDDALAEAQCALEGKPQQKSANDTRMVVYGDVPLDYAIDHLLKDKRSKQWKNELAVMRDSAAGKI